MFWKETQMEKIYHSDQGLPKYRGLAINEAGGKVLWEDDDRLDIYELDDNNAYQASQKRLAASTTLLTMKENLTEQDDGTFLLHLKPFRKFFLPPCNHERFRNQKVGGFGSGFMVGPDVIVTAGHCGKTEVDIQETAYVFGFQATNKDDSGTTVFTKDQVYFGKKLIAHELSDRGDFAVVRVDRMITAPGARPIQVRQSGSIARSKNVGVIGYPSGLPVKIAFGPNTEIKDDEDDDPWRLANVDTYGGNSGSPVFNTDGIVEGILVRGAKDYEQVLFRNCFQSHKITNEAGGEVITKAIVWVKHIPEEA